MSLFLVCFFAAIYWLDDLYELKPILRIFISFISGIFLYSSSTIFHEPRLIYFFGPAIFYGLFNVALTNTLNFYDGADLNIAVLIFLSCISFFVIPDLIAWRNVLIYTAAFTVSFSLLNQKANFLYFGDSGTFAFSCLVTIMFITLTRHNLFIPLEFLIPFLLPIIDVLTVLIVRIKKNDNLLTRNYLHLYQKLGKKFKNKIYLLPQILNFLLCLITLILFRFFRVNYAFTAVVLVVTTLCVYILFLRIISRLDN